MRRSLLRSSIGTKIFGAFLAMGLIVGALGLYGYSVLSAAGRIVVDTYDGPLMSINFARAASVDFVLMQKEFLRRKLVRAEARSAIDTNIDQMTETFHEDLQVAEDRSYGVEDRRIIQQIRTLVDDWTSLRHTPETVVSIKRLDELERNIIERFEMLIETNAGNSFVARRKAVWSIYRYEYATIGVTLLALILSCAITLFLTRRIIRPLGAAAEVADRIAGGELTTPIPVGGKDETGILLNSMTVMQDNIRTMMEREQAQRQTAEARLVDAIESSQEGVVLLNAHGMITLANSRLAEFFPYAAREIVTGRRFVDALPLIRDALVLAEDAVLPSFGLTEDNQQKVAVWNAEYQLRDGRWIRLNGNQTSDGGFILFLADFSDIKEREENYRKAKQEAEAASAAKSNFLANMSHELRTPLNAIIGFAEVIFGQVLGKVGNAQYAEYAGDIAQSGRRLLQVINSVLDLARSDAGKVDIDGDMIDLRDIIEDCAEGFEGQCADAKVTLTLPSLKTPLMVWGEPAKLKQIFFNLFSNAIKFTEPGGAITVRVANVNAGTLTVEIEDTGIGMSTEDIEIALTPFGQVDNSLARRHDGAGLGLPLTKALIGLHGGKLEIASEPGRGTRIDVTLRTESAAMAGERWPKSSIMTN